MNTFNYFRASDAHNAIHLLDEDRSSRFLAGGTNLVDLMREGIETPHALVDITRIPLSDIEPLANGDLRIGALVRNSHLAAHPLIRERYPLLSFAILNGASAQLRNMATTGAISCSAPAATTSTMKPRTAIRGTLEAAATRW